MMKKVIATILCAVLAFGFAGCGKDTDSLIFWAEGNSFLIDTYQEMVDEFNNTAGKEKGIKVKFAEKTDLAQLISRYANTKSGADLYIAGERQYKQNAIDKFLLPLDEVLDLQGNYAGIWDDYKARSRYDITKKVNSAEGKVYGLPITADAGAIYYNKDAMEAVGVKVISVDEADLADFNAGRKADRYGKTKAELGIAADVPARGYYRSMYPYISGEQWEALQPGELAVFNDRIAMNWDENEDLAMLLTRTKAANANITYNPNSPTKYGYYNEWWFNYGWSVGGDCITDISPDKSGTWTFSLTEYLPNYIVADGKSLTIDGTPYHGGETLQLFDKLAKEQSDVITADDKGGYKKNGVDFTSKNDPYAAIRPEVKAAAADGTLTELPSTVEAFERFVKITDIKDGSGLGICPFPSTFSTGSPSIQYFYNGEIAMIFETSAKYSMVEKFAKFNWGIAPAPVYKKYGAETGSVIAKGRLSTHSDTNYLAIKPKSAKIDKAAVFADWMIGEQAQKIMAQNGFIPVRKALADDGTYLKARPKGQIFLDSMNFAKQADWAYLTSYSWISSWATPLNEKVRKGSMSLSEWSSTSVKAANEQLLGRK